MKKLVSTMAIVMFMLATACKGEPTNLLIGKWKLTTGAQGCNTAMTFAAKTVTQISWDGKTSTIAVTYVTGEATKFPAVVYVMTDAGITYHVTYIFSSKDKVMIDSGAMCTYERV
ncbi:MAG TPA: hypothetical protein VG225_03095 [Terracidiphilus sp.]|nr:hypothetical protein [Terracidiphilus sp.]